MSRGVRDDIEKFRARELARAQEVAWDMASEDALERGLFYDAERKVLTAANPFRAEPTP